MGMELQQWLSENGVTVRLSENGVTIMTTKGKC